MYIFKRPLDAAKQPFKVLLTSCMYSLNHLNENFNFCTFSYVFRLSVVAKHSDKSSMVLINCFYLILNKSFYNFYYGYVLFLL